MSEFVESVTVETAPCGASTTVRYELMGEVYEVDLPPGARVLRLVRLGVLEVDGVEMQMRKVVRPDANL